MTLSRLPTRHISKLTNYCRNGDLNSVQNHLFQQIDIPEDDEDDEMSDDDPVLGLIAVVNVTEKQVK